MNNGATSEMNSNLYRNVKNNSHSNNHRNKSSRSNVSHRKKKKHYSSIGQTVEKWKTGDLIQPKNFTDQLISLIQKIHSPKASKSHNHSQSEVTSQTAKRMINGRHPPNYKVAKKSSMHIRSNTSENAHKIKMKMHSFYENSNAGKHNDTKLVSPTKDSLTFSHSTTSNKFRNKNKKKSRKSAKSLYQNNTVNYQNPMTPQTQGSISNENTFIFSKTQNKSL